MKSEDLVAAQDFCIHHHIELSFLHSLQENGMIETVLIEEQIYLPVSELQHLEKIIRLRFKLDINLEGIETITHLLDKIERMQAEINNLNKRLKHYQGG